MSIDHRISVRAVLAAAAFVLSPSAWALGLGDATVESFLNQPLQARIDLISRETDDLGTVTARLASAADYELIGASREAVSVPIRFTIEDVDGDPYILATSTLPITDPVLRLIVEVNWASGRMLREYTLFLDPPTVPVAAPAPPRIDQRSRPAAAMPAPEPSPAAPEAGPTAEAPAAAPVDTPAPPPSRAATAQEYGPVRSGETLWEIARDWQGRQGLGINRVMIAIQRENPDAFANGNINLLKRGAILRMPAVAEIEDIPSAAANREVAAQQEEFSARRTQAVESPSTPVLVEESRAPAEEPAPPPEQMPAEPEPAEAVSEPSAETESAEAAPQPVEAEAPGQEEALVQEEARDQLELVPPSADEMPESAGAAGGAGAVDASEAGAQQLRESLARTEEELINQQQQNAYLEERIRELESRLKAVEERSVDDADLASMEDRLRAQREAAPKAGEPWYARVTVWLIGLLVLAAGLFGWWLSRRGRAVEYESVGRGPSESLQDLRGEAEDVLRTLGEESAAEVPAQDVPEEESGATVVEFPAGEGDAEILDEESSDPEIQLDLARAYISMGDKEAARIILDEVVNNGNERQQEEARKMLDLLASS